MFEVIHVENGYFRRFRYMKSNFLANVAFDSVKNYVEFG